MSSKAEISHPSALFFEKIINAKDSSAWFLENRYLILYSSVVYMIIGYICRNYMKTVPPINLRRILLLWNTAFAAICLFGASRMASAMYYILKKTGSEGSLCKDLHSVAPQSAIFWVWLFVILKSFQLADGLFSTFRKKEYASFYSYYRMCMMVLAFYTYGLHPSEILWYAIADYVINVAVYGSYTLKSLGIRKPRSLTTAIIMAQIFRIILDFLITVKAIDLQLTGSKCNMSAGCAFFNIFLYFSFIIIFCGYFYDVLFVGNRKDRNTSVKIFLNLVEKFILFLKTFNTLYQGEDDDELKDM
ncbi:very long chain fatty acid elongase 6-like [Centruroides vittatus]|uniref:very long chain fatty acid elongase 6-like n=1 Tax=Centruroides vittatus TaxID=120091 RepID=UPI0035103D01